MIPGLILALALLGAYDSTQNLLNQLAQAHADRLSTTADLYHSDISPLFDYNGGPCEWAGEVLYVGGNPGARWDAYAESPSHNKVINMPRTHHGVGIADRGATLYVVVDIFCLAAAPTTTTAPTPAPTSPPPDSSSTTTTSPPQLRVKAPPLCPHWEICVQ